MNVFSWNKGRCETARVFHCEWYGKQYTVISTYTVIQYYTKNYCYINTDIEHMQHTFTIHIPLLVTKQQMMMIMRSDSTIITPMIPPTIM